MSENELSIDGVDLEGRHVVIAPKHMGERYQDITWRVVLAKGGFGCSPNTIGKALFIEHVRDGDQARYERYYVERLATDAEVEAARSAGAADRRA